MNRLVTVVQNKISVLDEHTLEVVKKSFFSTIVKVIGIFASLLFSVFLGRTLGADGLGIINLSNRIINILLIFSLFGTRQIVIKEIAIAKRTDNYQRIGDIMKSALWFNCGITLVLSVMMIILSPWIAENLFADPELTYPLIIFLLVMTPQVLSRVYSAGLIGYKKIWQSNLVDQTLSIVITGLLLLIYWSLNYVVNITNVAICYAVGRIGVTLTVGTYWSKINQINDLKTHFLPKKFFNKSYLFFFITGSAVMMANADAVILGMLTDSKNVGLYTVAARIALMTSFFLQVTNSSLSPKIAALYSNGQDRELKKMVGKVTKGLFFLGLTTLLIFVFFGRQILGIWGSEFSAAYWVLVILGFGQFVNLATGAVGLILIMTGHEKIQTRISLISLVLIIVLNIIFIKSFGILGAAFATALIISGENIAKLFVVKYRLKIL